MTSIFLFIVVLMIPQLFWALDKMAGEANAEDLMEQSMRMMRQATSIAGGSWGNFLGQIVEVFAIYTLVKAVLRLRPIERVSDRNDSDDRARSTEEL